MAADNASAANNRTAQALLNDLHNTPGVTMLRWQAVQDRGGVAGGLG